MNAANPFAQPATPDAIIAQLTRQVTHDYPQAQALSDPPLETLVDQTVQTLWTSRVKTFVPVFALREVEATLANKGLHKTLPREPADLAPEETADAEPTPPPSRDALIISAADDVVSIPEDDVMRY